MPLGSSFDGVEQVTPEKRKKSPKSQGKEVSVGHGDEIRAVDIKEAFANVGVNWLQNLKAALQDKVKRHPDPCRKWITEIQKVLDRRLQRPNVTIALYGQTGSGKSSIISAICDRKIVHCNAMQAGTEFITVIGYNHQAATPGKQWRGEILTITQEEWTKELDILLGDLHDLPDGEIPTPNSSSDANYAIAKILAVYPQANREEFRNWTTANLVKLTDLRAILDHTHQYSGKTLTAVKKQMEQFTGSRTRPKFSPLVTIMKIFGPIEFLRRGLEIADVPGSGDSNAARCRVAEQYQSRVNAFWIVSPIVRAVDDNIAKSLFGTAWKQMMQLDGKLTEEYITFVMTKCDDITVSQVFDDLEMTEDERVVGWRNQRQLVQQEIRQLLKHRGQLQARIVKKKNLVETVKGKVINASRDSSPGSSRTPESPGLSEEEAIEDQLVDEHRSKRSRNLTPKLCDEACPKRQKREENAKNDNEADEFLSKLSTSIDSMNVELLETNAALAKLKDRKQGYKSKLTQLAISARSDFSVERIRASFSKEIHGTQASNNESTPKQDTKLLPVFCVSCKAYDQHRGRNIDDQRVEGYPRIQDTQVPQLREHCVASALSAQLKFEERFSSDLDSLVAEMRMWAENKEPERKISAEEKDALMKALDELYSNLSKTISEILRLALGNINAVLRANVEANIVKGATLASQQVAKIVASWFKKDDEGLQWNTMRACARRGGAPHKAQGIRYRSGMVELNADLAEPFQKAIAREWNHLVCEFLPRQSDRVTDGIAVALNNFLEQMRTAITSTCDKMSVAWSLLQPSLTRLLRRSLARVKVLFYTLVEKSGEIHRLIMPEISRVMRPAYDECGAMKGKGTSINIRLILTEHIGTVAPTMFNNVARNMIRALSSAIRELKINIYKETQEIETNFKKCYTEMVIEASNTIQSGGPRPENIALQQFILENIFKLEQAQAQMRVCGPEMAKSLAGSNGLLEAACLDIPDSSAQVGEDDYVSEDSDDGGDENYAGASDDEYQV